MSQPLISILVPVYNCEPYLDECINSILNQDYGNLQIVLANDGSTDNSLEICRNYAVSDGRIKVLTRNNKGVAITRNDLLEEIEGDYFLFVDADDWIEPNMVSYLVHLIQKNNADIAVCSNFKEKNLPSETLKITTIWDKEITIKKFLFHKEISGCLWNKLIKTDLLFQGTEKTNCMIKFQPCISYGEDALFFWKLLQNLNKIVISQKALYHYRLNISSLSHTSFGPKKLTSNYVWSEITKETKAKYPKYFEISIARWGMEMTQLLLLAAKENYERDDKIKELQKLVGQNLSYMRKIKITSLKGIIFAWLSYKNYNLTKALLSIF